MSARSKIVNAIVALINDKLDGSTYASNIFNSAKNKLIFWDEIDSFPEISVTAGNEQRQYQPSNFTWGFLNVNIRIYVQDENPQEKLEQFIDDIESILEENHSFEYDTGKNVELVSVVQISTDEGLLSPTGVAELSLVIQYELI